MYRVQLLRNTGTHPAVAVSSEGIFRPMRAVVFVLAHSAVKGSGSKWRNVLSLPYSSGDALSFLSVLASLEWGHRIKNLLANNGK